MYYFPIVFLALSLDLETFLGSNALTDLLPLVILLLGVGKFALVDRQSLYIGVHWNKRNIFYYFVSFLIFTLAVARSNTDESGLNIGLINSVLKYIFFSVFVYVFISHYFKYSSDKQEAAQRIVYIILLTILIETVFYTLLYTIWHSRGSVDGDYVEPNMVLGFMGIYFEKRQIPFIEAHPNTMGIYYGSIVVFTYLLLLQKVLYKPLKKLLQIYAIVGTIFLFLVDSRGTIGNTFLSIAIVYGLYKIHSIKLVRYFVFITPLLPFIMLTVFAIVAETSIGSQISRQENDLATGNNRSAIWEACVEELSSPKVKHFFGYGAMGQYAAGVSKKYAWIFGGTNADKMVTHNYFFQMVFDIGYFGVLFFFIFLYKILNNLILMLKRKTVLSLGLIGFFFYFMLSGTSESVYGIYNKTYYMLFVTMSLFSALYYNEIIVVKKNVNNEKELKLV